MKLSSVKVATGVACALAAFEVLLRLFATVTPEPYVHRGEFRQFHEGISVSHYRQDGERITGNASIAGGKQWLLVGDSHVEADQVGDEETMGAVLERKARQSGLPLNVHQYGLSGANVRSFIAAGPELRKRTAPDATIVLLNAYALGFDSTRALGRLRLSEPLAYFFEPAKPGLPLVRMRRFLCSRSVLASEAWIASGEIRYSAMHDLLAVRTLLTGRVSAGSRDYQGPPADVSTAESEVAKLLRGLQSAYPGTLLVVYDADLVEIKGEPIDPTQDIVLKVCKEVGIDCIATRSALIEDRNTKQRFSRGFHNTAPGLAHFNAVGHERVADLISESLPRR